MVRHEAGPDDLILHLAERPGFSLATRYALERAGVRGEYRFAEGPDAAHALIAAASRAPRSPDLVILDIQALVGSGHALLERIRREPALRRVPLVLITGSSAQRELTLAYRLGVTECIARPASLQAFADALCTLGAPVRASA